jgi:hypothetical protein
VVLARGWLWRRQRRRWRDAMRRLKAAGYPHTGPLESLLAERYRLLMQMRSLAAARRLLALWHAVHIPLGAVLFTLAFVHVGAALYYATWSR